MKNVKDSVIQAISGFKHLILIASIITLVMLFTLRMVNGQNARYLGGSGSGYSTSFIGNLTPNTELLQRNKSGNGTYVYVADAANQQLSLTVSQAAIRFLGGSSSGFAAAMQNNQSVNSELASCSKGGNGSTISVLDYYYSQTPEQDILALMRFYGGQGSGYSSQQLSNLQLSGETILRSRGGNGQSVTMQDLLNQSVNLVATSAFTRFYGGNGNGFSNQIFANTLLNSEFLARNKGGNGNSLSVQDFYYSQTPEQDILALMRFYGGQGSGYSNQIAGNNTLNSEFLLRNKSGNGNSISMFELQNQLINNTVPFTFVRYYGGSGNGYNTQLASNAPLNSEFMARNKSGNGTSITMQDLLNQQISPLGPLTWLRFYGGQGNGYSAQLTSNAPLNSEFMARNKSGNGTSITMQDLLNQQISPLGPLTWLRFYGGQGNGYSTQMAGNSQVNSEYSPRNIGGMGTSITMQDFFYSQTPQQDILTLIRFYGGQGNGYSNQLAGNTTANSAYLLRNKSGNGNSIAVQDLLNQPISPNAGLSALRFYGGSGNGYSTQIASNNQPNGEFVLRNKSGNGTTITMQDLLNQPISPNAGLSALRFYGGSGNGYGNLLASNQAGNMSFIARSKFGTGTPITFSDLTNQSISTSATISFMRFLGGTGNGYCANTQPNQSANLAYISRNMFASGNSIAMIGLSNVNLANVYIWCGGVSRKWGVAGNWIKPAGNTLDIPIGAGVTAKITTTGIKPEIDESVTIEKIVFDTNSKLKVLPGGQLTVSNLVNDKDTVVVLVSDSTGTGSLIANNTNAHATVQRYVKGWTSYPANLQGTYGWHLLSSPVASQAYQPVFVANPPSAREDFYMWRETDITWRNSKVGTAAPYTFNSTEFGTAFHKGTGYLCSYDSTSVKEFKGAVNVDSVVFTGLTLSGPITNNLSGWHLLGNPYPSALRWNYTVNRWNKTNIASKAKVWNEQAASYKDIAAGDYIPAMQGFMVQVTDSVNKGSITIPAVDREHSASNWYKSSSTENIVLSVKNLAQGTYQESVIGFDSDADNGYDTEYDSHFLPGFASAFYTCVDNHKLSSNIYNSFDTTLVITTGFEPGMNGMYSFKATDLDAVLPLGTIALLEDLKNGTTYNLSQNNTYNFTASVNDHTKRFRIRFTGNATGITEHDLEDDIKVSYDDNHIIINSENRVKEISVYNLLGQRIYNTNVSRSGLISLPFTGNTAYYFVNIITDKSTRTYKVYVH